VRDVLAARHKKGLRRVRTRILTFIAVFQSVQFLAHWFVYETWISFWGAASPLALAHLQVSAALLSISFVSASLLAFRFSNVPVRLFYRLAAAWLGLLVYFFLAASACWLVYPLALLAGLQEARRPLTAVLFGSAIAACLYGIVNASWTRVHRVTIKLPNLPAAWRGRTAALVSDTHLGHVRNRRFLRRIVALLTRLGPDAVFIAGDVYDGTRVDTDSLAEPWSRLSAPLGAYFVAGNHEEFSPRAKYLTALEKHGIRILNNEKVTLDGLQLVGMHFSESADPDRFRSILQQAAVDRGRSSVLLCHAPHHLAISEQEGVSLQLSGHTHGGQFFPFTLIVSRIYGQYVHGLQRFGSLQVFTTWGAGTWGPPLRVGTQPEIVLLRFE
jgi:predicted MPP superfamily phosphohydrolase